MVFQTDINLPSGVSQHFQTVKDFFNQSVNSVTNSAQQFGHSLQETATTTTDKAIDQVTTSLGQSLQTAEQFKNTTTGAVQGAIASSFHDWLIQHPGLFKLVQILSWGTNHPIISIVILLFALALLFSIIKAIIRVIETASWSILQVPLKLILALIQASFLAIIQVGKFAVEKITGAKNEPVLISANYQIDKQQRLAEISTRLEAIQKEQNELLQEAADLITSDSIKLKIPAIKPLETFESHLG